MRDTNGTLIIYWKVVLEVVDQLNGYVVPRSDAVFVMVLEAINMIPLPTTSMKMYFYPSF